MCLSFRKPRLRQLKIFDSPLLIFFVLCRFLLRRILQRSFAQLLGALELLLLREDVGQRAFPTKEVAAVAGDGVAGGDEAEAAAAKGEEGVAAEAGGGGRPAGFGEGAFVGREDGAGGVSLA